MTRHIVDMPRQPSGERLRAYLRIARRNTSLPERRAIYRTAGRGVSEDARLQRFLRIDRGLQA